MHYRVAGGPDKFEVFFGVDLGDVRSGMAQTNLGPVQPVLFANRRGGRVP